MRENPYGDFNFLVNLGGAQGDGSIGTIVGGFSEVSGLGLEVDYLEYRNGNERESAPRLVPAGHRSGAVVLRRGVVGSTDLFAWLKGVADGNDDARVVVVTLLDESRTPVVAWKLRNARPARWTGPSLSALGGGTVAIEELVLLSQGIEME